jgi:hypothetical protein
LPGIRDYENGVPDFAMGYFPAGSAYLRKFSYDVADNLTKQLRTHSLKFGVYSEVTANNQVPYNFTQGLYAFNHYNYGCTTNDGANLSEFNNNVANFAQGCGGYSQSNSSVNSDLHFRNIDFYAQDEWKATKKLTLTLSMRFEHLGAWFDPNGLGMAVWTPPAQHVLSTVTGDPRTYPGISWHQTDPSDPISGEPSRFLFYSPRGGLAYDLYGNGKTTIRTARFRPRWASRPSRRRTRAAPTIRSRRRAPAVARRSRLEWAARPQASRSTSMPSTRRTTSSR